MLNLFSVDEEYNLIILPETLALIPFRNVIKKYRSREYAKAELTYIYFMVDYRSDFKDLIDKEVRSEKILEVIYNGSKIIIDKVTEKAIDFYNERQPSLSLRHLESMELALYNLQQALSKIDLMQVIKDDEGNETEIYDTLALGRITTIIKESPKIIAAIKEMEKQVKTELQENTTHRGSGQKSIYEDDD